ncbi:MAG TPA: hypothetical protein VNA28_14455 [Solirubrobacteraceae bacterium]|nr:hypothetical protein [Solirubrobacteraceae bacterium]
MADTELLQLQVAVDRDSEPIHGTLDDGAGIIEFTGWLELMSAFDTARDRSQASTS